MHEQGTPTASVAVRVGRGAAWGLLNNSVLRLGSLVSGIVLARLLSPADYGVYAVALVALTLLQSFNELGVSLALVRWDGDVRRFAPTVMTVATVSSLGLYAAAFLAAPTFCAAMGSPTATFVLRLMCLAVIVDGIATVPIGLLNRHFRQRERFAGDAASFTVSTGLTIALAVAGVGPASFAYGRVAGAVVGTVIYTWLAPLLVRPGWSREQAGRLLRFGLPLAGASLLVLSVSNVDNIIVGGSLDAASLGVYLIAFNLSSWPLTVFAEAARRVALAGFSRLAADLPDLERSFSRGMALLMTATVPLCALLASYADPLIRLLYGDPWAPAAVALPLLAILGLMRVGLFVCYDLLVALDRSRLLIGLQALWLAALIPALIVGTAWGGIRGTAAAHVVVVLGVVGPAFVLALRRLGLRPGRALLPCLRPLLGGAAIVLSAWVVRSMTDGGLSQLAAGGLVALLVYAPVLQAMRSFLPGAGRTSRPQDVPC